MKCPRCSRSQLKISVAFAGEVACSFSSEDSFEIVEPVAMDSSWDDSSQCLCLFCSWSGSVAEARRVAQPARKKAENKSSTASKSSLTKEEKTTYIKKHLHKCPKPWRGYLTHTIGEIERLQRLILVLERAADDRGAANDDTVIR